MTIGATTFGIVRKRMADLYKDFADRIKVGGAFGTQTTVDSPDTYPGDPLVQLAAAASGSSHELWEAVEFFFNQLDPETAEGLYFIRLHADRFGLTQAVNQTDEEFKAQVLEFIRSGKTKNNPEAIALSQEGIECAKLLRSTNRNPIEGIPTNGAMLLVKGCAADYALLAETLAERGDDFGLFDLYGDIEVDYLSPDGDCIRYNFQPACRIFIQLKIQGYFEKTGCEIPTSAEVIQEVVSRLKSYYSGCGFGQQFNSANTIAAICDIPGFTITDIEFQRRAKALWPVGCDTDEAVMVEVCDEIIPWASSQVCGYCQGEMWCMDTIKCLTLEPWEFPDFDIQFTSVDLDLTKGDCV